MSNILEQITGQPPPTQRATVLFVKNFPLIITRLGGPDVDPGFFLNVRGLGSDRNETLHGVLRDKAKTFSCAEFIYMIRMAMLINVWRSVGAHVAGYHHKGKGNTNNFIRFVLCDGANHFTRQVVSVWFCVALLVSYSVAL